MSEKPGSKSTTPPDSMPKLATQKPLNTSENESAPVVVVPQPLATKTLAQKINLPANNKKGKVEGTTKAVIQGFIPPLNFFTTKTIGSSPSKTPGTFLNFTIANGELRQSTGPPVTIREKRTDSSQKPIIVTVSGLPGTSSIPTGTHQVQIDCSGGGSDKNNTVTTTLSSTNAASILSALSSALPIGNAENKTIPIVVATGKGNPAQTNARIISVPVVNAKVVAATGTTTYKKIEPKPTGPVATTNIVQTTPSLIKPVVGCSNVVTNQMLIPPPTVVPPSPHDDNTKEKTEKSEDKSDKLEQALTNGEVHDDKSVDPNSTDYDPIQAMDWEDGIATLPGSNLKFKLNEFGTLELAMDENECKEIKEMNSDPVENGIPEESPSSTTHEQVPAPAPVPIPKQEPKEIVETNQTQSSRKRKAGKITPVFGTNEAKMSNGKNGNDIQNCHNCGGMGIREEFYQGSDFCSHECLVVCSRKMEMRKKRKERMLKKRKTDQPKGPVNLMDDNPSSPCSSDESLNSNNVAEDTPSPMSTAVMKATRFSHGFSWTNYLFETSGIAASSDLFQDFQDIPFVKNHFKVNMKLEGIDPKHPSLFCVFTVVEVVGFRIRLHFDGYSDCFDFWVNADSPDIFPVGWCEKTGHKLQPPKGYTPRSFNWTNYIKASKAIPATKSCFYRLPGKGSSLFKTGMKLEAVDKKNTSLVCVATIMDTMDDRFLVHFDGWDDMYDYWADSGSPYIHPINWCRDKGHVLTPPNNYKDSNNFNWERYLIETKSTAVPVEFFKERPPNEFKIGMKLEVVDKRNPVLIRVASIVDTQPHAIKINFDGWSEDYDYWLDDDSPDIHPPLWCQNARYPLQPPCRETIKMDQNGCPTIGCFGIGHLKGPKFTSHHSAFGCPYSVYNLNKENPAGDRLGLFRSGEAVFIEPLVKKSEAAANALQQHENTKSIENHARFRRCPTPGCSGAGHVTGKFTVHHSVSGCPIAAGREKERGNPEKERPGNPDKEQRESQKSNGSSSPLSQTSIKLEKPEVSLAPPIHLSGSQTNSYATAKKGGRKKFKSINNIQSGGKNPQVIRNDAKSKLLTKSVKKLTENNSSDEAAKIAQTPTKEESDINVDVVQDKVHHSIFTSTSVFHPIPVTDETSVCWNQHSLLLPGITQMPGFNVMKWNSVQVASFIAGLTGSYDIGKIFNEEQIDGESLMLLTQTDLTKILSIKLGPALKIFNSILMFRKRFEAN